MATDPIAQAAIEQCAAEPVHIPGIVQPFGCLVAIDPETSRIAFASENTADIFGVTAQDLLGQDAREVLGREVMHGVRNAQAMPNFAKSLCGLGAFEIAGRRVEVHAFQSGAFQSGAFHVLEIEPVGDAEFGHAEAFKELQFLLNQTRYAPDAETLFAETLRLLKYMTGYDRVMVYRFDAEFNGEILAEERPRNMEAYAGLRFPHWDIPAQARALMAKLPLRFIEDIDQEPVPLRAHDAGAAPLDITLAASRGVSPVHMQYLRNMGVAATMTLSILVDDRLWGMISFHHRRPRVPSPRLREVLTSFIDMLAVKLKALQEQEVLAHIEEIDAAKIDILADLDNDQLASDALDRIGPVLTKALNATGVAMLQGSQTLAYGDVPEQAVLAEILKAAKAKPREVVPIENLAEVFPDAAPGLNGCAGALSFSLGSNRAFCVFRPEIAQTVKWAGNPEKKIERVEGTDRLAPRASFSVYLEEITGRSTPWTEQDHRFMQRIWPVMNAVERNRLLQRGGRAQQIMIDELNHRVRNILALVRSVSRQSRRRYGSLESYSAALESRIQALAASHEISTGTSLPSVSVAHLINREMAPFMKTDAVRVSGIDPSIRSEVAPIFSLIIHELTTNAVKYGALSVESGRVDIRVSTVPDGVEIRWQETGGPEVAEPEERGFGSTLIESAVPHELNGRAELRFDPKGVTAVFALPVEAIDVSPSPKQGKPRRLDPIRPAVPKPLPTERLEGSVLLVEDNFIIAREMVDQLGDFGFLDVNTASDAEDALALLNTEVPVFAILDVNLGAGQTSLPVAERLTALGVPFAFATGYGETAQIGPQLSGAPRLLKPVTTSELQDVVAGFLAPRLASE